jgi:hypothetical protein
MAQTKQTTSRLDIPIILGAMLLVLFASPLTVWWGRLNLPWYVPYLLWALIILLTAWFSTKDRSHEP